MAESMIEANDAATGGGMLLHFLWRCGTLFTGVVALAMGVLYVKQESLLYFPAIAGLPRHTSQNPKRYRSPSEHNVPFETHMIPCADGTAIHSWLLYHPENNNGPKRVPTIVFFHGNAGNIGMRLPNAIQMYHYLKANIWLVEYRGFGDSDDAVINEAGLKMDAEAVWSYVHNNNMRNVDPRRLFVFGRSLGGAVAFHLAQYSQSTSQSHHPPLAGVIVENTFLSISEMVDHLMPYVAPFKPLILRMNWNSGKIAPSIKIPTLFLAGAMDTLVPHSHMLELSNRMKKVGENLVRLHVVEDGTHNETWMQGGKEYWMSIRRFIDEVFQAERASGASYSKSLSADDKKGNVVGGGGPFQRKGSSLLTSTTSASTLSGEGGDKNTIRRTDPVEVDMGCEGEDAADMISSVGNFMGMAREATRSAYKKKD